MALDKPPDDDSPLQDVGLQAMLQSDLADQQRELIAAARSGAVADQALLLAAPARRQPAAAEVDRVVQPVDEPARLSHGEVDRVLGGLGVLVVPRLLVRDFLSCGLLVDLGLPPVRGSASYKAGVNPGSPMTGSAVAFCRWLSSLLKSEADG